MSIFYPSQLVSIIGLGRPVYTFVSGGLSWPSTRVGPSGPLAHLDLQPRLIHLDFQTKLVHLDLGTQASLSQPLARLNPHDVHPEPIYLDYWPESICQELFLGLTCLNHQLRPINLKLQPWPAYLTHWLWSVRLSVCLPFAQANLSRLFALPTPCRPFTLTDTCQLRA